MKNRFIPWLTLFLSCLLASSLLSGCNNLTQYTLSEQDVNAYLQKHNNFSKNIGIAGLANAHIDVTGLTSEIGRSEPNTVRLTGNARINIESLFGSQQADAKLTLQAQPYYDKNQGAIYLKEMRLVDFAVEPANLNTTFRAVSPYLDHALKSYFDNTPAYVLDAERNKTEALAKRLAQGIEVKPGKLVIPFS